MWLPPVLCYMHHYSPNLDTSPCHGAPLFSSHNIALYSPTLLYTLYCHTVALNKTLKVVITKPLLQNNSTLLEVRHR